MALNYFASKIADKYNLKYEGIGGSVITGIYVNKISFKKRLLVDKISIKYNILNLLDTNPDISLLKADRLHVSNMKSFIDSLSPSKGSSSLNLKVDKISLNIAPYTMQDIKTSQININLKNFILTPLLVNTDIEDMNFYLNASKNKEYRKLLKDFKLKSFKSKVSFNLKKKQLKITLKSNLSSFFTKNLTLEGKINYSTNTNFAYKGRVHVDSFKNLDKRIKELLNKSIITFDGTNKNIRVLLKSDYMKALYNSQTIFDSGKLQINSREILVKDLLGNLNDSIKNAKLSLEAKSYINYKDINNTLFDYKIKSDIVNMDGNYTFGKKLLLSHVTLPKNSLLSKLYASIYSLKLFPINMNIRQKEHNFKIKIHNTNYNILGNYNINNNNFAFLSNFFNSNIKTKMDIKGDFKKGKFKVYAKIPQFSYRYDKDKKIIINNFYGEFNLANDLLILKKYSMKSNIFDKNIKINCDKASSFDFKKKKFNFDICSNFFDANISGSTKKSLLDFQANIKPKNFISKNFKLNLIKAKAILDINTLSLQSNVDALLSSNYTKNISIKTDVNYTKGRGVFYNGKIIAKDFKNMDQNLSFLLKNSTIYFNGNAEKVNIKSASKKLKLSEFIKNLNSKFKNSKFSINLKSSVRFKDLNSSKIIYHLNSDLVNIGGEYFYKTNEFNATLKLPKNSLLIDLDKNLHVEKIFPLEIDGKRDKSDININAKNDEFNLFAKYNTSNDKLHLKLQSPGILANIEKKNKSYKFKIKIDSLMIAKEAINSVYDLPNFRVDAQMNINGVYKNNEAVFKIKAPWFLYQYTDNKFFFIEKSLFNFSYKNMILSLKNYKADSYILENSRKLFSNIVSVFDFRKKPVKVDANINNLIKIEGKISDVVNLDIKTKNYHLKEPEANIYLDANINYYKDDNGSAISGKVDLLKGVVRYKPKNSYEINDKDIVFVNDIKSANKTKQKRTVFINIMTKKEMLYMQDKNRVKFKSDITIYQEPGKRIKILGYVEAIDGVYYSDDKKFEIGDGRVMYDGDFLNPFLDLKAYYEIKPYKITLLIGGRLGSPLINFSSNPYLSQSDILSMLLFGTKFSSVSSSKNISTNQALALFGNTFAKGIVNSIGIKLDRVQLLTTNEGTLGFSVEKQLSKKISIIYQNDLIQSIKMKYKPTKHIETDLTFSPDSSGIEILYK